MTLLLGALTTGLILSLLALGIYISYRVFEQLQAPHFGFRLTTASGQMITDISTWSLGMDLPTLPPGEGSIDRWRTGVQSR